MQTSDSKPAKDINPCLSCRYKKRVGSRQWTGVKIPGGPGKCCREGGICEAKRKAVKE